MMHGVAALTQQSAGHALYQQCVHLSRRAAHARRLWEQGQRRKGALDACSPDQLEKTKKRGAIGCAFFSREIRHAGSRSHDTPFCVGTERRTSATTATISSKPTHNALLYLPLCRQSHPSTASDAHRTSRTADNLHPPNFRFSYVSVTPLPDSD